MRKKCELLIYVQEAFLKQCESSRPRAASWVFNYLLESGQIQCRVKRAYWFLSGTRDTLTHGNPPTMWMIRKTEKLLISFFNLLRNSWSRSLGRGWTWKIRVSPGNISSRERRGWWTFTAVLENKVPCDIIDESARTELVRINKTEEKI